jgi:hypothetical protein
MIARQLTLGQCHDLKIGSRRYRRLPASAGGDVFSHLGIATAQSLAGVNDPPAEGMI